MKTIKVRIRDTKETIFNGEVDRVTSYNEVGPFDIYPMHANFISIVKKELSLYLKGRKIKELKFAQAILKVKQDSVGVFLGIEELVVGDEAAAAPKSA